MSSRVKVVAISGSVQTPSRTVTLVNAVLERLGERFPIDVQLLELTQLGPQFAGALHRSALPDEVRASIEAIEHADLLIAATPVYRASYTGLFKHLFDFVHYEALKRVPVLLAATGGSERHALVIDHQLRPLFGFFQADTLPLGIYATERDFDTDIRGYRIVNPALTERIERALDPVAALFDRQPLRKAASLA